MNSDQRALLTVRGVSVSYEDGTQALDEIDLVVRAGEVVALVGESGSGKSTFLAAVLGMLTGHKTVCTGQILLGGDPVDRKARRRIGYIPQDPLNSFNPVIRVVAQGVEALRSLDRISRREAEHRVVDVLGRLGVDANGPVTDKYPFEFSGGMRQRALIGISLSARPTLILADEPTASLDVIRQSEVLDLFARCADDGLGVLFITHDIALARERAHRVVVLRRGRIVEEGSAKEVFDSPREDYTRTLADAARRFAFVRSAGAMPATRQIVSSSMPDTGVPVLSGTGLGKRYGRRHVLSGVDFSVRSGSTLAVVGASGSGKSTLASLALGLVRPDAGELYFRGSPVADLDKADRAVFRRSVQPVFQDPHSALDPTFTVERSLDEARAAAGIPIRGARERRERLAGSLSQVGLPVSLLSRYPHELSGGQKQRVVIARALLFSPDVLICDEAVSALDVLVQGQVIDLLTSIQAETGLAIVFVTHDLGLVQDIADEVIVLDDGEVVERGDTHAILESPSNPVTGRLIDAVPGGASRSRDVTASVVASS